MAELHSITGLFFERFPGISPWGGYFIRGTEEDESSIEGKLVDLDGISDINGTMDPELLEFRKQYEANNEESFDYKFSMGNGIWVGEYVSTATTSFRGGSVCKTNLCIEDLTFRKFDMTTPEGCTKALVTSMIEDGSLESYKDPDTGEDMIRPGRQS